MHGKPKWCAKFKRNRKVVILGIPEHFLEQGKRRERAVRYHIANLLRTVDTPEEAAIKRPLRPERWRGVSDSGCQNPRPTLVENGTPRHTDWFSASANRIKMVTKFVITVEPDDTAISRIRAVDARGGLPAFNNARLQVPKLKLQTLAKGGQINVTPCSGRAHLGSLSREPTPITAIYRKNKMGIM